MTTPANAMVTPRSKAFYGVATGLVLLFIYVPLALVVLNSFNTSKTFAWPPTGFTTEWWEKAFHSEGAGTRCGSRSRSV